MTILDTNIVSECMKPRAEPRVIEWFSREPEDSIFTTVITQAEILRGISLLPHGRRRDGLQSAAAGMFQEDFLGRVLPFDEDAATVYARIATDCQKAGKQMSVFDAMIAAIAISHGGRLATRNVADFANCGVLLVNPWD